MQLRSLPLQYAVRNRIFVRLFFKPASVANYFQLSFYEIMDKQNIEYEECNFLYLIFFGVK